MNARKTDHGPSGSNAVPGCLIGLLITIIAIGVAGIIAIVVYNSW